MKKLFFILFLMFSSLTLSFGQYVSPQTVSWDAADLPTVGSTEYEFYLIRIKDGVKVPSSIRNATNDYFFLSRTMETSLIVDLRAANLEGDFVVAIRTIYTYNEYNEKSIFAYSDVINDCDPVGGTFFLRYVKGTKKPTMIKFNGGA
jgi:hypothetical protein